MGQKHYKSIIYFITATIIATIAIQLYWNIQNYRVNKQRLINEVQISLDNGVEAYYSNLAKTDFFAFVDEKNDNIQLDIEHNTTWDSFHNDSTIFKIHSDSLRYSGNIKGFTQLIDSSRGFNSMRPGQYSGVSIFRGKAAVDSIDGLQSLANKIIVSIIRDSINFKKLDTLLTKEFNRKGIKISYALKHFKGDSLMDHFKQADTSFSLRTFAKTTYLPHSERLQLLFSNPTLAILKRSLTGILLSLLLSASIIACLFYLLRIINKQKELAEIKNDLISNITHEFKTPIATVSAAVEGIQNFNDANDPEKTKSYLEISSQQLNKLHQMVEKLLETAIVDNDKLLLNREAVDLVFMLQSIVEKYGLFAKEKTIEFKTNVASLLTEVDAFHFENAISNLIDNALKYGGDTVEVNLNAVLNTAEISVADNGGNLDKSQTEKIFDKFYRVPTGNQHDVKGFGIGLFYTKKIIEKHGGSIHLVPHSNNTIFKVVL